MRPGVVILACGLLLAGCGSITVRENGSLPPLGSIDSVQVVRGDMGDMPADVAEACEQAMRSRLDHHGLSVGSGAQVVWRVTGYAAGNRTSSVLTCGLAGSARVVIDVRVTTAAGVVIQAFTAEGSDNSIGARQHHAGRFAGRAAADQIARVLGVRR